MKKIFFLMVSIGSVLVILGSCAKKMMMKQAQPVAAQPTPLPAEASPLEAKQCQESTSVLVILDLQQWQDNKSFLRM